jgi:acetyl-CoA carboxylase carboxyl transferase subunit alpha
VAAEQGSPAQRQALDFEKPILDIEEKIAELQGLASVQNLSVDDEVRRLTEKADRLRGDIYSKLSAWQKVQLARHPRRPYTLDYISAWTDDFVELHGDRTFADDAAIVAGLLTLRDKRIMVIGHQKGRNTSENIYRNFGMPHPEGYRKAQRLMKTAERFRLPVVTLIDTPGAYPGLGAEERGQSSAIAESLKLMAGLEVPLVSVVVGEGGSGGALALGVTDRILMLEYSIYSVISPEGCAAILWKDQARAEDAARALRVTAKDLKELGVIDEILPEPSGGAHMDPQAMAKTVEAAVRRNLKQLRKVKPDALVTRRYKKYRAMGMVTVR